MAAEQRAAEQGKLFRFFLKAKEEAKVTFVDGELSPEGFLIPPRFYEHTVQVQGAWHNYVCPEQSNPGAGEICPICKSDRPSLVSLFTIIDHRPFNRKDGTVVPYSKKLLVVKPKVMELLAKQAVKRGGLAGCTFEVSRMDPNAAAIGDVWDFVEKGEPEKLHDKFTILQKDDKGVTTKLSLFSPANYDSEIVYYSAQQLMERGLGGVSSQQSYSPGGAHKPSAPGGSTQNYKDAL